MTKIKYISFVFAALILGMLVNVTDVQAKSNMQAEVLTQNPRQAETPLMIIRFYTSRIMFEKSLYNTMTKALQVRPDARFDVVSIVKKSSNPETQKRYLEIARRNFDRVMTTLHEMGMPNDRLTHKEVLENVRNNEIKIYVD